VSGRSVGITHHGPDRSCRVGCDRLAVHSREDLGNLKGRLPVGVARLVCVDLAGARIVEGDEAAEIEQTEVEVPSIVIAAGSPDVAVAVGVYVPPVLTSVAWLLVKATVWSPLATTTSDEVPATGGEPPSAAVIVQVPALLNVTPLLNACVPRSLPRSRKPSESRPQRIRAGEMDRAGVTSSSCAEVVRGCDG